jgi:hypothetical protein
MNIESGNWQQPDLDSDANRIKKFVLDGWMMQGSIMGAISWRHDKLILEVLLAVGCLFSILIFIC